MTQSILEEPVNKAKAAVMLASGVTGREVARRFDLSDSAVSDFKRRNLALIERLQQQFIEKALPDAQRTARRLVKQYSHPKARAKLPADIRQHAHQHVMETMKAAGLYPGNQSISIQKLSIQDHSQSINIDAIPDEELFERLMKLR